MSEGKLTNVYVWSHLPREWHVREMTTGIGCIGGSRDEVLTGFREIWADRSPFNLVEHAPPRPRRPDVAPQQDKLVESRDAHAFYRALLREFHPDHHPDKTYSGTEVVAAINHAWESARR